MAVQVAGDQFKSEAAIRTLDTHSTLRKQADVPEALYDLAGLDACGCVVPDALSTSLDGSTRDGRLHRVSAKPAEPAASHRARLDRADEHLNALAREISVWLDRLRGFIETDVDADTGLTVLSVPIREHVPDSWGPVLGDVLHNYRSSLDHLVYALTATNRGSPLPPDLERVTEFPIFADEAGFRSKGARAVRGTSAEAQTAIEELQPYRRGDDWEIDPLWLLKKLSNIDKHRRAAITSLYLDPMMEVRSGAFADVQTGTAGPATPENSPFRIGAYRRHEADDEAQISPGYGFYVAFMEDGVPQTAKVELILWTIGDHIRNRVFSRLEPLLANSC